MDHLHVPVYRLRQVLNQLQLEGYLTATNDEYAILRLTPKAASVLNNEETVWMKLAKEQTKSEQETQKKSRKKKKKYQRYLEGFIGVLWLDPANLQRQRKTYLKHCENFGPRSQKKKKFPRILYFLIRHWLTCAL